jgi:hypothetical protein
MQEKLTKNTEGPSSQEKKDLLSEPFLKEVDQQIEELDLSESNSFSEELVKKAYGILKFRLPELDSFIISRGGGGKNSWRLINKRRELYKKIETILYMEKEKRLTNLEKEIEEENNNAIGREMKIPKDHIIAA